MRAEQNKTYAQILNGKIHFIFTSNELPEWNENAIEVIDITGRGVQVGWLYENGVFSPPAKPIIPYYALRMPEYPPFTDYLDGVVKGDQAQIDAYIAACQAVKTKYPKPESV